MSMLFVLNSSGDVKITWDPNNAESVTTAREEVAALKQAGYHFFLVDTQEPADEVAAGRMAGELNCRRVEMDELVPPEGVEKRGPGRPRNRDMTAVATRPLRGG